jgi:hypothetical protein
MRWRRYSSDLQKLSSGIFLQEGIDRFWVICPTGELAGHQPILRCKTRELDIRQRRGKSSKKLEFKYNLC